jgi:hypothetical protein
LVWRSVRPSIKATSVFCQVGEDEEVCKTWSKKFLGKGRRKFEVFAVVNIEALK